MRIRHVERASRGHGKPFRADPTAWVGNFASEALVRSAGQLSDKYEASMRYNSNEPSSVTFTPRVLTL